MSEAPAATQTDRSATAFWATPPNPWMLALWWIGGLGTLTGGGMVAVGLNDVLNPPDLFDGNTSTSAVLVVAGGPLLAASLVALIVAIALRARAWDRAQGRA